MHTGESVLLGGSCSFIQGALFFGDIIYILKDVDSNSSEITLSKLLMVLYSKGDCYKMK